MPGTGEVVSLVRTEAEAHLVVAQGRVFTLAQIAALIANGGRMTYWTPKMVEARLAEAVSMLGSRARLATRTALLWFLWLQPEDAQLLWMRVERRPWKEICQHFGISRATANRRVEYLLSVIAWKLNHHRLPKWSRRFLVERTQFLSSDM